MKDSNSPHHGRRRRADLQHFLREHHSSIGMDELKAIGFSSSGAGRLVEDGTLRRESKGVYRGGSAPDTLEGTLRCRLLRAGDGSLLVRRSAAHHLGYLQYAPKIPQIGVPGTSGQKSDDEIERHAVSDLEPGDLIIRGGLACTSPFKTLLHLAADAAVARDDGSLRVLRRVLRAASGEDDDLVDRFRERLDRAPFPGSAVLARELGGHAFGGDLARTQVIKSSVEDRFVELCMRYDIPIPETNVWVGGFELDAFWVEFGAYVEISPYATHGDEVSFHRDQGRAAKLAALNLRGFPVSDLRIDHFPDDVAADVRGMLGLR